MKRGLGIAIILLGLLLLGILVQWAVSVQRHTLSEPYAIEQLGAITLESEFCAFELNTLAQEIFLLEHQYQEIAGIEEELPLEAQEALLQEQEEIFKLKTSFKNMLTSCLDLNHHCPELLALSKQALNASQDASSTKRVFSRSDEERRYLELLELCS
ncbi:DUF4006 family protein [Candidatus Woesearchaeota archaeon]|nr:MAG: DUF4006 family protein [Candidatus Woesearchaeota archaeon]